MFTWKKLGQLLYILPPVFLSGLVITVLAGWQYSYYFTYSFFISWGILFLYYIIRERSIYSLLLLGLAAGATGLYLDISSHPKTEPTLLIGKIALAVFTIMLALRLYRIRNELEGKSPLFIALVVVLLLRTVLEKTTVAARHTEEMNALSLESLSNYAAVGIIANILLNDNYGAKLKEGEKKFLSVMAIYCLYNIGVIVLVNYG